MSRRLLTPPTAASAWALLLVGILIVGAASGARAEPAWVREELERKRQQRQEHLRGSVEPADLGHDHDVADAVAVNRCLGFAQERLDFVHRAQQVDGEQRIAIRANLAEAGLTADVVNRFVLPRVLLRTLRPDEVLERYAHLFPRDSPLPEGAPVEVVASACLSQHVMAGVGVGQPAVALPADAVGTWSEWHCSKARALPAAGRRDSDLRDLVSQLGAHSDGFVVASVATVRAAPRADGAVVAHLGPGHCARCRC